MADALPPVLNEIREVAGLPAALEIAHRFGGSRVFIPSYPSADNWLQETVGESAAKKICDHYRIINAGGRAMGIYIEIPLGPTGQQASTHARVQQYLQEGLSADEVARRLGIHRRTVLRQAVRIRDPRQADLFEF
ncbi:hypothetical protein [Pseudovibrio sp. Ad37]|uniref:hypothetical protein n=1 Tax=Pseudovibrio sp. Ad37 TaxID=989422 RepID=UPI0007AEC2A0|nr:hypothetical protein [Pseudovibrio sp. Ad37]KZL19044.1 hypothetical protein PsAD37_03735 [Pseudovibrio sp. Ad37]